MADPVRAADIAALVVRDGLRMVCIGGAIGTGIALAAGNVLRPLLYGTSPTDPLVLGGVALVLVVVATIACLLPARRGAPAGS